MANYSRYYLAEQVMFKLEAGYADAINKVQIEDIIAAIGQKVNSALKLQQFTQTFAFGDTIPNNLMIATYTNIPITSVNGKRCKAVIPTQPVNLPRNMGIFMVDKYDDFRNPFIPVQAGLHSLISTQDGISDYLGQVGYEVYGNEVWMTKDLTIDNTQNVHMRLLIFDIQNYDDYTGLPLPSDMADEIIDAVYKSFLPVEAQTQIQSQPIKQTLT